MTTQPEQPLPGEDRWLAAECDRLLDFAEAARHPEGGFAWLDETGRPQLDRPVELWITTRMTHVFAVSALLGRETAGALADHGIAALQGLLRDAENGGWYAAVEPATCAAVDDTKQAYAHGFVVLAATSAVAAHRPGAEALLGEALDVMESRFWREDEGGLVDTWDRGFRQAEPYRGANATMHAVEAFLAAADATADRVWLDRALRMTARLIDGEARRHHWRLPEHYDDRWTVRLDHNRDRPADPFRPFGSTVGHGLEWSRLCLHLQAALGEDGPDWLREAAVELFHRATNDGWNVDGAEGFVYTVDWEGRPVVRQRMHWVVAEGIAAAAALHAATGEPAYAQWYDTWWRYADRYLLDRANGSWWHELDPGNTPAATVWPGKPDAYHAVQATLLPRLPLTPTLARAVQLGQLRGSSRGAIPVPPA